LESSSWRLRSLAACESIFAASGESATRWALTPSAECRSRTSTPPSSTGLRLSRACVTPFSAAILSISPEVSTARPIGTGRGALQRGGRAGLGGGRGDRRGDRDGRGRRRGLGRRVDLDRRGRARLLRGLIGGRLRRRGLRGDGGRGVRRGRLGERSLRLWG